MRVVVVVMTEEVGGNCVGRGDDSVGGSDGGGFGGRGGDNGHGGNRRGDPVSSFLNWYIYIYGECQVIETSMLFEHVCLKKKSVTMKNYSFNYRCHQSRSCRLFTCQLQ